MIRGYKIRVASIALLAVMGFFTAFLGAPAEVNAAACSNSRALLDATYLGLPTFGCGSDRSIIETLVKLTFGALAMLSILFMVIGGLRYALSGGDSNAIASAKKTIQYAVLGLILGISVFVITSFIFGVIS